MEQSKKDVYDFGMRLQKLRKERRLTQKDVADRLQVHTNTISGYENNTIDPPMEKLVKMALMYNSTTDYILGLSDRQGLFVDDLPDNVQKLTTDIVSRIRKEYEQ